MQRNRRSKNNMLNAREYIDWVVAVTEGYERYGACPAMAKLRIVGRAIVRAHDEKRRAGNRKDIYIGASHSA